MYQLRIIPRIFIFKEENNYLNPQCVMWNAYPINNAVNYGDVHHTHENQINFSASQVYLENGKNYVDIDVAPLCISMIQWFRDISIFTDIYKYVGVGIDEFQSEDTYTIDYANSSLTGHVLSGETFYTTNGVFDNCTVSNRSQSYQNIDPASLVIKICVDIEPEIPVEPLLCFEKIKFLFYQSNNEAWRFYRDKSLDISIDANITNVTDMYLIADDAKYIGEGFTANVDLVSYQYDPITGLKMNEYYTTYVFHAVENCRYIKTTINHSPNDIIKRIDITIQNNNCPSTDAGNTDIYQEGEILMDLSNIENILQEISDRLLYDDGITNKNIATVLQTALHRIDETGAFIPLCDDIYKGLVWMNDDLEEVGIAEFIQGRNFDTTIIIDGDQFKLWNMGAEPVAVTGV